MLQQIQLLLAIGKVSFLLLKLFIILLIRRSLAEIKSVVALNDQVASTLHDVRAKLGNGWSMSIDYVSFAEHTKGLGSRTDVGKKIVTGIFENEYLRSFCFVLFFVNL